MKYRYEILTGDIQKRCRELLIQVCDSENVRILSGVVSKDHIHMHIEYRPSQPISNLVKRSKGRSSRLLQKEYTELPDVAGVNICGPQVMVHGALAT